MARSPHQQRFMDRFVHDCACAIERDATVRIADDQLPWRRSAVEARATADTPKVPRPATARPGPN